MQLYLAREMLLRRQRNIPKQCTIHHIYARLRLRPNDAAKKDVLTYIIIIDHQGLVNYIEWKGHDNSDVISKCVTLITEPLKYTSVQ